MSARHALLIAALLALYGAPAPAQPGGDPVARCNAAQGTAAARRIEGCTALIESGRLDAANLASAFNNRGVAYSDVKDYDRAIADFDEAIRLNPALSYAYANRGGARGCRGDYDLALADCDAAIRIDPENANAYNNRGLAWAGKQAPDRAIADYTAAVELDPEFTAAFSNRGIAYMQKRDYVRAIADFDRALALDGRRAAALYWRGFARVFTGDTAGFADIGAAFALDPGIAGE